MKSILLKGLGIMLFIAFIIWVSYNTGHQAYSKTSTIPALPQPIGRETVLITSAGQSTDTYLVKDIANKLMIHNFFMPQAQETDLEDINTVVIVAGFSELGEKLHDITFEEEKKRIGSLIKSLQEKEATIITIYLGGNQRRNFKTDALLDMICKESHYIIATASADEDNYLSDLSRQYEVPLTLTRDVKSVYEPFASAFR